MARYISFFGQGKGNKELLGGKGFELDDMVKAGFPVPEGFTITTDAYHAWKENLENLPGEMMAEIKESLVTLEEMVGQQLGGGEKSPLLVSVRSGAVISMPGMMDTILNVGSTNGAIKQLAEESSGDGKFAWEAYRRFMYGYMNSVHDVKFSKDEVKNIISQIKASGLLDRFAQQVNLTKENLIDLRYNRDKYSSIEDLINALVSRRWGYDHPYRINSWTKITNFWYNNNYGPYRNEKIRLEGSLIKTDNDQEREGTIDLVTESYMDISWNNTKQRVFYNKKQGLGLGGLNLSLVFQLVKDAEDFLRELATVGEYVPDTLRLRKYLLEKIPEDPIEQIIYAVQAVFRSWNSERARVFREERNIDHNLGTAVNIQRMVFGNKNNRSGTAVVFSSSPRDGEKKPKGEYLIGKQGEELVSGEVTPQPLEKLAEESPQVYSKLVDLSQRLEEMKLAIQDTELTWEDGRVYVLQTRSAKISPRARLNFLIRGHVEGRLTEEQLIARINIDDYSKVAGSERLYLKNEEPLVKGTALSDGILPGRLAFDLEGIERLKKEGNPVIYCRDQTSPEDVKEIKCSDGLLTTRGGSFSHAAIVALDLGKLGIVGCQQAKIENKNSICLNPESPTPKELTTGDWITLDGYTGDVYAGKIETIKGRTLPEIKFLADLAKRRLRGKKIFYEIQTLEDLREVVSDLQDGLVYVIDFDCFDAASLSSDEQNRNSSKAKDSIPRPITERLIPKIANLYQQSRELRSVPILASYNHFDPMIKEIGIDPELLKENFIKEFLRMQRKAGKEKNVIYLTLTDKLIPPPFPRVEVITFTQFDEVILSPWRKEESYLLAAQRIK